MIATLAPRLLCVSLFASFALQEARGQTEVIGWGRQVVDSRWNRDTFVEFSTSPQHTLARRSDGSVVAFGDNAIGTCIVPALPAGLSYVQVAAGLIHSA